MVRGGELTCTAECGGLVSSDAPDPSALVRAVHDAWDRRLRLRLRLRLVHTTIADKVGDGYPWIDVDRWGIEVRVPLSDDEAEAAPVRGSRHSPSAHPTRSTRLWRRCRPRTRRARTRPW